ncbi:MAG: AI-2E family transporter [Pseudomonadota bacterium]
MTTEVRILWLAALAFGGFLLYLLAPVLTPFVAAALLAYVGDPLADKLQKLRLPRPLAVLVVFLLTFVVVGGLVLLLLPLVQSQVAALLEVLPRYVQLLEDRVWPHIAAFVSEESAGGEFGLAAMFERFGSTAGSWGSSLIASLGRSGTALLGAVINLFLIPILTFYLLRDWDVIMGRVGALIPSKHYDSVMEIARESDETLGAFLRGQLLVMIGLAVIYTVGLSLIGLKFALAIGIVAGLVSFVPYLGFIFGIGLAGLTALNMPDSGLLLILVVVVFSVAQFIEGSVLTPKLVGDRIGLHPVLVIFAVMAFGQLFGFFGILLALPAAAVIAVLVRHLYMTYLAEHPEMLPEGDVALADAIEAERAEQAGDALQSPVEQTQNQSQDDAVAGQTDKDGH